MTIEYSTLYIGGKWVEPATSATISVHSPTTEELIGSVPEAAEADIDKAVDAARSAFDDP
ncbi:aldehyde dehydrogenase family protein, partial [Rhodococcus qingshengii]